MRFFCFTTAVLSFLATEQATALTLKSARDSHDILSFLDPHNAIIDHFSQVEAHNLAQEDSTTKSESKTDEKKEKAETASVDTEKVEKVVDEPEKGPAEFAKKVTERKEMDSKALEEAVAKKVSALEGDERKKISAQIMEAIKKRKAEDAKWEMEAAKTSLCAAKNDFDKIDT